MLESLRTTMSCKSVFGTLSGSVACLLSGQCAQRSRRRLRLSQPVVCLHQKSLMPARFLHYAYYQVIFTLRKRNDLKYLSCKMFRSKQFDSFF